MKCLFVSLFCLFSTLTAHGAFFGKDSRQDITPKSPMNNFARSTAIAVLSSSYKVVEQKLQIDFSDTKGAVCRDQRFSQQPSLSYACTGFLVAPNILATAGHCMVNTGEDQHETQTYCKAFSWLFDYQVDDAQNFEADSIPEDKLYHCKEVIYAINQEVAPYLDFALVKLDRPALGRNPFKLAPNKESEFPLSMIGYPLGMPAKFASDAKLLLDNPNRESFITNLDAFEGNSGSPVFNKNMEVVGILVAGTPSPDMIDDISGSCGRYNSCDENGNSCVASNQNVLQLPSFQRIGSEVQRIAPLVTKLQASQALPHKKSK